MEALNVFLSSLAFNLTCKLLNTKIETYLLSWIKCWKYTIVHCFTTGTYWQQMSSALSYLDLTCHTPCWQIVRSHQEKKSESRERFLGRSWNLRGFIRIPRPSAAYSHNARSATCSHATRLDSLIWGKARHATFPLSSDIASVSFSVICPGSLYQSTMVDKWVNHFAISDLVSCPQMGQNEAHRREVSCPRAFS